MNDQNLEKYQAPDSSTVLQAMHYIDRSAIGIVMIVTKEGKVIGSLSDGDIRRALLTGVRMEDRVEPYANKKFIYVDIHTGRAEVLDLMRALGLEHVPVLDDTKKLVGIHILRQMIGAINRKNAAVIMAGGQGMRLRPLTDHLPKPMIKVAGRPILERLLLHLIGFGIRDLYISVHHLGQVIEDHFGDGSTFGCSIRYLREEEPLGTGGALSLLDPIPDHPILVVNGDLITQADIGMMLRAHDAGKYDGSMAIRRYGHMVPFGCVDAENGQIVKLEEKPLIERFINAGIYVLNPELLHEIPRRFFPITELFAACLAKGRRLGAFEVEEEWLDVGQRDQIKQGNVF